MLEAEESVPCLAPICQVDVDEPCAHALRMRTCFLRVSRAVPRNTYDLSRRYEYKLKSSLGRFRNSTLQNARDTALRHIDVGGSISLCGVDHLPDIIVEFRKRTGAAAGDIL